MPMAATSVPSIRAARSAWPAASSTVDLSRWGSGSTQAGRGKCWGSSAYPRARTAPSGSTTSAVEPVVPWSSARTKRRAALTAGSPAQRALGQVGPVGDDHVHAEADEAADGGLVIHRPHGE